jgi:hypothetical protein
MAWQLKMKTGDLIKQSIHLDMKVQAGVQEISNEPGPWDVMVETHR